MILSSPAASVNAPAGRASALSPQEYARAMAACEASIHTLESAVAGVESDIHKLDGEMYDHVSMQEACAHDLAHAQSAARSAGITTGVGAGIALAAAVGCGVWGSIGLGVLAAASALVAFSASRTRARALEAEPKIRSMKDFVDREIISAEQTRHTLEDGLRTSRNDLAAQKAHLELLQVASRVSTAPATDAQITRTDDAVKIGGVSVPRRETAEPHQA